MKKIGMLMMSIGIVCVLISACMSDKNPEMPVNIILCSVILGTATAAIGYFLISLYEKAEKKSTHRSKAISAQSDHRHDQQLHF